ncbi:MAG: hypothetical protein WCO69_03505 [Candidatus Omnitrophota bacterium]
MNEAWRKFLAFEWLMLVIFGFFWGTAMWLVLFLSGGLADKEEFWRNFFIMVGPYAAYLVCRSLYLLYRSLRWAYLVANFLFRSEAEKTFAQEWLLFVILGVLWAFILIYPLYVVEMFSAKAWPWAALIMVAPYGSFLVVRWVVVSSIRADRLLNEERSRTKKEPRAKG